MPNHTDSSGGKMRAYPSPRLIARGTSLIEVIMALAVVSILAAAAYPSLHGLVQSYRVQSAASQLAAHMALARGAAIARGQRVAIAPVADAWSGGWRVHLDLNANGRWDPGEDVLAEQAALPGVVIRANGAMQRQVLFEPSGRPIQANGAFLSGSFAVCAPSSAGATALVMSAAGRLRQERQPAASCVTAPG